MYLQTVSAVGDAGRIPDRVGRLRCKPTNSDGGFTYLPCLTLFNELNLDQRGSQRTVEKTKGVLTESRTSPSWCSDDTSSGTNLTCSPDASSRASSAESAATEGVFLEGQNKH